MSIHGCWLSFLGICLHLQAVVSWAVIFVGGRSFLFVGIPLCSWVVGFVRGHSFPCGGVPLLGWWMCVAVHGVVVWLWGVVVPHSWWLVAVCCCGLCDMAVSHVKNEVGSWGYGDHLQKQ